MTTKQIAAVSLIALVVGSSLALTILTGQLHTGLTSHIYQPDYEPPQQSTRSATVLTTRQMAVATSGMTIAG